MNVSIGKFVSKLFRGKHHTPKKTERKEYKPTEAAPEIPKHEIQTYHGGVSEHNNTQAMKAEKIRKRRKNNKVARIQRAINRKGGKS